MKRLLILPLLICLTLIDINAQSINYVYDSLGRLMYVIYPDSSTINYSYDAAGNRLSKIVSQSTITIACPLDIVTFYAGLSDTTKNYQWQTDTSGGFFDLVEGPIFSGVDSSTLILMSPPTYFYGYKYRCIITDTSGQTISSVFTLKFETSWIGAADTAWENSVNWNCGILPDANTDVIIKATAPRFPEVNSIAYCRKLYLQYGASVLVNTGFQLNATGGE